MQDKTLVQNLYLLNLTLLFTHELDSAFWHEWDLFGLPGGIQLFLALNLILLFVALLGLQQVNANTRSGYILSLVVSAGGIFAFCVHSYFLIAGNPTFTLPFSIILIVLLLPISLMQAFYTLRILRPPVADLDISRHSVQ